MPDQTITREHLRAKHALNNIRTVRKNGNYGHYATYVKSLPASIRQNGLGQALATLLAAAKGKQHDPHRLLYNQLNDWLCSSTHRVFEQDSDLLDAIIAGDQMKYVLAQAEALAYLTWLKKFAAAFLKAPERKSAP